MNKTVIGIALIGSTMMITPTAATAAPIGRSEIAVPSNVQKVQHHRRGFYRQGGHHYYNGHRGYRYYRPGYRRYGDRWFPGAAFAAGALIGGAIANQPDRVYAAPGGDAHVRWCEQRYRSYDPSSDTYQPYEGPRRRCVSPY